MGNYLSWLAYFIHNAVIIGALPCVCSLCVCNKMFRICVLLSLLQPCYQPFAQESLVPLSTDGCLETNI